MAATKTSEKPAEPRTGLTKFLRVALSVALVGAVGAIIAIYFGVRGPSVPTGPVRTAAQEFFNDLKTKNFHDAYGSLCTITKQSFTEAQFVAGEQNKSTVDSYTIANVTTQHVDGAPAGTVVVNLTRGANTIEHHSVPMVQQNGRWFVCGEPY